MLLSREMKDPLFTENCNSERRVEYTESALPLPNLLRATVRFHDAVAIPPAVRLRPSPRNILLPSTLWSRSVGNDTNERVWEKTRLRINTSIGLTPDMVVAIDNLNARNAEILDDPSIVTLFMIVMAEKDIV